MSIRIQFELKAVSSKSFLAKSQISLSQSIAAEIALPANTVRFIRERPWLQQVQLTSSVDAASPGAIPGRIIGGRELPTSPLTTDSDGPPCAAGNPGPAAAARPVAIPGHIIGGREPINVNLALTTDSDGSPYADQRPRQQQPTQAMTRTNPMASRHLLAKSPMTTDSSDTPRRHQEPAQYNAAFQQRSIHSSASASKQHPNNNSVGGASSTKNRQKQSAHHLESEGYPGVSKQSRRAAKRCSRYGR